MLDHADQHLDRLPNAITLPIAAAFVMVQWDLVMDPPNSTLAGAWQWHDGGSFFGVPPSNYAGWFITVWLVFQAFAMVMRRFPPLFARPSSEETAMLRLVVVLLYLAIGLSQVAPLLTGAGALAVDAAGRPCRTSDVRASAILVMAFTMLPSGLLALFRQFGEVALRKPPPCLCPSYE